MLLPTRISASILRVCGFLFAATITMLLTACGGSTCAIITRLDAQPQWVCPGQDFSPEVSFRFENLNEDREPSSDGTALWRLLDTTKGKWNQPGAVVLNNKVGTLNNPGKGIWETPGWVHVVSGAQAAGYQFTLIASNDACSDDGETYLKNHQAEIEKLYGVTLDDNEVMNATTTVELVSPASPRQLLCVPHALDVQGGYTWILDEVRAGNGIVINGVENTYSFPLEVKFGTTYVVLQPAGDPASTTNVFNGQSPNGKWFVKTLNSVDYDHYMDHGLNYVGKPSICLTVTLACQNP